MMCVYIAHATRDVFMSVYLLFQCSDYPEVVTGQQLVTV